MYDFPELGSAEPIDIVVIVLVDSTSLWLNSLSFPIDVSIRGLPWRPTNTLQTSGANTLLVSGEPPS